MSSSLRNLIAEIRQCRECEAHLPFGPNPILAASEKSKILIVGQAPGLRVHESGVPWNDPSGDRLRSWMGLSSEEFYDTKNVAIVPMGFCYPGTGKSGDLPPRPECSKLWHGQLLPKLKNIKLTLVIGNYAHAFCLRDKRKANLTATVNAWKEYRPDYLPLPHPSPRNNRWLKKNDWFERDVLPYMKQRVQKLVRKK